MYSSSIHVSGALYLTPCLSVITVTPSAPNMLTVWSISGDSVTLNWYKPSSDGGAEIIRYVISRRQMPGGPWEEVGSVNGHTTSYTVISLREGVHYCFAVYAVNKKGEGDVMETSKPVMARGGAGTCGVEKGLCFSMIHLYNY